MENLLEELKKPFPVSAISWRIGQKNKDKTKAKMLCYIDARDVMDRLDEVCGTNWSDYYEEVKGRVVCTITIDGKSRSDGAGDTDIEGEKGGLSDAFKRAAVKWGIGRYLYNAKDYNTWVSLFDDKGQLVSDFDVLKVKANKEQLDNVARKLSGENPTKAKANATRAVNKEIEQSAMDKRYNNWLSYWMNHNWSQDANESFRKFLEEAKDYDPEKMKDLIKVFKDKAPELNDSMPDWA